MLDTRITGSSVPENSSHDELNMVSKAKGVLFKFILSNDYSFILIKYFNFHENTIYIQLQHQHGDGKIIFILD